MSAAGHASALSSRVVSSSPCKSHATVFLLNSSMLSPLVQVQWLINVFEESKACALPTFAQVVTRQQWPDFIYSLTVADMHAPSTDSHDISKSLDS